MAPVIFFLRPGYPSPKDPEVQFEERRFGGAVWRVRNWRVMIEALQVRGRNIRSATDRGSTIFISQHFRKFLYASLPEWLKDAYRGDVTFEEAKQETLELLK
jgi:Rad3-related DNA helicase